MQKNKDSLDSLGLWLSQFWWVLGLFQRLKQGSPKAALRQLHDSRRRRTYRRWGSNGASKNVHFFFPQEFLFFFFFGAKKLMKGSNWRVDLRLYSMGFGDRGRFLWLWN